MSCYLGNKQCCKEKKETEEGLKVDRKKTEAENEKEEINT